jgi:uncharacterized protein (TIGR03382 family)
VAQRPVVYRETHGTHLAITAGMTRSLIRTSVLLAVSHIAISVSSLDQARACSLVENTEHVVDADEEAVDTTPPEVPVLEVMYSREPAGDGCFSASSCQGSGSVGLGIEMAVDDRTSLGEMGYVIELAGGELPSGMRLPASPVRADYGVIWLHFSDHDQDIDFTLSVRAMDLAGNLGEPVLVEASDGGSSGCSTGARSGPATLILVILALAVAVRRRRDAFRA